MIKGGYRGKVLRVNLTDGNITTDPLPDEQIMRQYVGNFGLGLAIAKSAAELLNGKITAYNQKQGAVFEISFCTFR